MDARPLTLRALVWMADGRQRAEWERTSWVMAWVGRVTGGPFEPDRLNPFAGAERREAARRRDPDGEAARGWAMLAAGLKRLAARG